MKSVIRLMAVLLFVAAAFRLRKATSKGSAVLALVTLAASVLVVVAVFLDWSGGHDE